VSTVLRSGERTFDVGLAAEGAGFVATLDGATLRVTRVRPGPRVAASGGATVDELGLEIDGRPCRALVARLRDRVLVTIDGLLYAFETGDAALAARHGGTGSGLVAAPMPGKVIAVLVAEGDAVEVGQPLVLVEAMKMETTLAAEIAGTVQKVAVAPGQLVECGQILVELR
jgi:3-methylcrotonyl-CoA carboxylase alpha subunit